MNIDRLADLIRKQADRLFPARTDSSMFLKIYSEVAELIDTSTPEERSNEFADLMILLLDYAERHNILVEESVLFKMSVNEGRKWNINELGVAQHVE